MTLVGITLFSCFDIMFSTARNYFYFVRYFNTALGTYADYLRGDDIIRSKNAINIRIVI